TNHGVGPCIDRRAQILNKARNDVAIDIHADGGPASGRGVAILTPVPDGPNDKVIASSRRFGRILLHRYTALTGIPVSNYDGSNGFAPRDNPAGLRQPTTQKPPPKSMAAAIPRFLKSRRSAAGEASER